MGDPVPTLLYDSREQIKGSGQRFNEKSCTEHDAVEKNSIDAGHEIIEKLFLHK